MNRHEPFQSPMGTLDQLSMGRLADQAGFELVAAKQGECGLTIGYWRTALWERFFGTNLCLGGNKLVDLAGRKE